MSTSLISFLVYPENKYLYAVVNIWPTKQAMYDHKPLDREYDACCIGQEVFMVSDHTGRMVRRNGKFAELNFQRSHLGVGTVSHEMTHAAFCWAERVKLPLNEIKNKNHQRVETSGILLRNGPEERFCYALGEMVQQFTRKCYDLKIYGDLVTT